MSCFEASDHEGHDVQFLAVPTFVSRPLVATTWPWLTRALLNRPRQVDAGGSCDCGDTEAWSAEGCCPKHRPDEAADGTGELALPPFMEESARNHLATVVSYILHKTRASSSEDPEDAVVLEMLGIC